MNEQNDGCKQEAETCGPGCSCGTSGSGGRGRMLAGTAVLLVAGVLVVRAVTKDNGIEPATPKTEGFSALTDPVKAPATAPADKPAEVAEALKEIASFTELNAVAMGSAGVFIYVPAADASSGKSPLKLMQGAARTIEPQLGGKKIGLFSLKSGSVDYEQLKGQMPLPGVIVLVPGGRMMPVTGDITETKLIQGFVGSVQSCGGGGCGPSGCG